MKSKEEMIKKEMQYNASISKNNPNTGEQQTTNPGNTTSCIHRLFKSVNDTCENICDAFSRMQPDPDNTDHYPVF
jgi:hypothetical protein